MQEAVHLVLGVQVLDGHPCGGEPLRVGDALVAQRVELRGHHERGGQPCEI